ncbi:hypothetical protein FB451DRAFT_1407561 [Mycena latifolia]|nr:hypothetical protein FB451DRAFT_1407561 [Mycena latifolia]
MTGNRGSANQYMETIVGGLQKMDMADAKNVIALTMDSPKVMQPFRRKFQARFPWLFACFLHGLNTIIGKISAHVQMLKKKKTNGFTPITTAVIKLVMDSDYWHSLDELICICKPFVDAIGNLEAQDVTLADCMLELIRCARHMAPFEVIPEDDLRFVDDERSTFSHEFHEMNTDIHALALFLHPLCRKIAISQVAKAKTFQGLYETVLTIARSWGWDSKRAGRLVEDLQQYMAHILSKNYQLTSLT